MKKSIKIVCLLVVSMSIITACKGPQGDIGPQGTAGTIGATGKDANRLKGDITGFVNLFDETGNSIAKDGMKVTLVGSSPEISGTTNEDGKYELKGVESGTYDLAFTKTNFGTFRRLSVPHLGGNAPTFLGSNNLWETAKTVVSKLSVEVKGTSILVSGASTPVMPAGTAASLQRRARVFFGKDDKVSFLNYVSTFNQFLIPAPTGSDGTFALSLTNANFSGFKSGDKVFIICYGISPLENAFTDIVTGRTIFSGVNPTASNVVSVTLP